MEGFEESVDGLIHIDLLQVDAEVVTFDLAEVEQLVDERDEALGVQLHDVQVRLLVGTEIL